MIDPWLSLVCGVVAYAIGATPFGFLMGKLHGIDIREKGSGNIGATNVLRVLGKRAGIPVFLLDFLKGLVPVVLAKTLTDSPNAPVAAALGSILGHNYTFWLGFKGGKGIATSAGALLGVLPLPMVCALAVWLLVFYTSRYVAVASIAAAICIPLVTSIQFAMGGKSGLLLGFSIVIGLLAIWRHRSNIRRLLNGTENRFVPRSKRAATAVEETA